MRTISLPSIARQAMIKYGFEPGFSKAVNKEVERLKDQLKTLPVDKSVEDMRSSLWSSIDNSDSLDLDQLEYCERSLRDEIHVFVAIADVDTYIPKSSAMDKRARQNGTSVYAEVETFPMIPEKLCNDLSSLREGEDRQAVVVDFFVTRDGQFRAGDVRRALVHNKAKLVYEPLGAWLEDQGPIPEKVESIEGLKDQILLQNEASQRLRNFRLSQGALELDTLEAKVLMENHEVKDIAVKHSNAARFIIENFMISANGTMTNFLEKNNFPYIQRILRTPEHWIKIVALAYDLSDQLPEEADAKALSDFLIRQRNRNPDRFPDLSLAVVKLLGHAEYDLIEPGKRKVGHFGLAVRSYTHSTAPNRRYVDIVLQRLIKAVLDKKNTPYTKLELQNIADWCTDRDQSAKKVERFMIKVAGAILLRGRIGEVFEGMITGASEKGTYVRLFHPPVEGRVMRNFVHMNVGSKVRVRLTGLDPLEGHVDFEGAN